MVLCNRHVADRQSSDAQVPKPKFSKDGFPLKDNTNIQQDHISYRSLVDVN